MADSKNIKMMRRKDVLQNIILLFLYVISIFVLKFIFEDIFGISAQDIMDALFYT